MWGGGVRLQGTCLGCLGCCCNGLAVRVARMQLVNVLMLAGKLVHLMPMWCLCIFSMIAMYYAGLMLSPDVQSELLAGTDVIFLSCLDLIASQALTYLTADQRTKPFKHNLLVT